MSRVFQVSGLLFSKMSLFWQRWFKNTMNPFFVTWKILNVSEVIFYINHLHIYLITFSLLVEMYEKDPMGFQLEFHFSPNEYFSNPVLTKKYFMKCLPDPECPFEFEGPEIYKCTVCINKMI